MGVCIGVVGGVGCGCIGGGFARHDGEGGPGRG